MAPFEEKTIVKDECTVHYWTGGKPGGPWVVFLHGAGVDHRMYGEQIPVLTGRYRLLLIDIRGHGLSRPMARFDIETVAGDVCRIMDNEGIGDTGLVGQSMGGNIAQEMAYAYPDRVRCLVVIDSLCNAHKRTWLYRFAMRRLAPLVLPLYPWRPAVRWSSRASAVLPAVRNYLTETALVIGKKDYNEILLRAFDHMLRLRDRHTDKPVLLVCGDRDIGIIKGDSIAWGADDPLCEFHMIPHAGHCANQDNPTAFNLFLTDFLNKHLDR